MNVSWTHLPDEMYSLYTEKMSARNPSAHQKLFAHLKATSGYWNAEMDENTKGETAFKVYFWIYLLRRMPLAFIN